MKVDPSTCPYGGRALPIALTATAQITSLARFGIEAAQFAPGGTLKPHDFEALFEVIYRLAAEAVTDADEMYESLEEFRNGPKNRTSDTR
ncbi:MAG: hypothetical protein CML68_08680 [Rhodobacteraceae bacterium]|nr:hypothetical protein [Paracoccaceae bacterium]